MLPCHRDAWPPGSPRVEYPEAPVETGPERLVGPLPAPVEWRPDPPAEPVPGGTKAAPTPPSLVRRITDFDSMTGMTPFSTRNALACWYAPCRRSSSAGNVLSCTAFQLEREMPAVDHCSTRMAAKVSGLSTSRSAISAPPSRKATRWRKSLSSQDTLSVIASTRRDTRMPFSTSSSPMRVSVLGRPLTSLRSTFSAGAVNACCQAFCTPRIQVSRSRRNSTKASRRACCSRTRPGWSARALRRPWAVAAKFRMTPSTSATKRWRTVRASSEEETGGPWVTIERQTVAPALGSLGSVAPSSLRVAALTRSSRVMPSHMAIAAATKTDE